MIMIAGCGGQKDIVAKVGNETISLDEFKTGFLQLQRTEENAMKQSFNDRKEFVKTMAIDLAKYQEGLARGFDKDPGLTESLSEIANRLSLDLLYAAKVTDVVLTPEKLRHHYDQMDREYHARHILLRTQPTDTAGNEAVLIRIDSIKTLIENGMDFGEAAVKFSEDASTAPDSGDLDWFPWGRMVGEFQEAIWKAKAGDLLGPIQTTYGYHLIKVTDMRKVENRPGFEDMKADLKNQMRNLEGEALSNTAREYVENLRTSNKLEYNEEALSAFVDRMKDPSMPKGQELAPLFTAEEKEKTAATYSGGKVTLGDLIDKIGGNAHRVDWNDHQVVYDLIHSIAEPKFLEKVAEKEGFLKQAMQDPKYLTEKRSAIVRRLEKEEITDKIDPTETEEKAYYESHLENFIQPENRTIREIFIKEDSVKAERIHDRAMKGEDFTKLALKYNEKESTLADTGRTGPFEQRRFGLIGKTAFRLEKIGQVSEIVKIGKNYSFVQLLDIIPSRTQTWEESKAQAKREYRTEATRIKQEELNNMVMNKYKLEIFEDKLASAWPIQEEEKLTREP
jgi:parvulin-like peptidyl-prolyl isomerase